MSAKDKEGRRLSQQEQDEQRRKQRAGLKSLGMVQPREETPAPFGDLPSPSEADQDEILVALSSHVSTLACVCGVFYTSAAKFCSECGKKRPSEEDAAKAVLAVVIRNRDSNDVLPEAKPAKEKLGKERNTSKKKRRKTSKDDFQKAGERESEIDSDDDDDEEQLPQNAKEEWRQRRDGGAYKNMVVDPIKGVVSSANKGLTDADLERRFAPQQSKNKSSLMSEEEARAMIKREKRKKGEASGSAHIRAQREAAEWEETKKMEKARRKSREREHLVVGRR